MPIDRDISNPLMLPPSYGMLTLEEVAERLGCASLEIKARETEGVFFLTGIGLGRDEKSL